MRSSLTRRTLAASIALLLFFSGEARGQAAAVVPAAVQIAIFEKVWTLDRAFPPRTPIIMLVVFQRRNRDSFLVKEELVAAARRMPGLVVRVIDLEETLLVPALLVGVDVVYLTPLRSVSISELLTVTRAAHIRSVTGVAGYVPLGVSVGVTLQHERPSIVINLPASRAEGSDFSSQLLKLARVIR
jgi:hypothetical protein